MKILIDIGHPAHVHLFRNFADEMISKGHKILFALRQKEFSEQLLINYGYEYIKYGSSYSGMVGKLWGLLKFDVALYEIVRNFKPDITVSHSSFYFAQVSRLLGIKNITLEDTGNMEQIALYKPFTNCILSPDCYSRDHGIKHLFYKGYHELAYLYPNRFLPDAGIKKVLGLNENEKYLVVRFVKWNATHDIGQGGLTLKQKSEIIDLLASKFKVFISSEGNVPSEFKKFLIKIKPEQMHHVLAFAEIVISEGATVASESGVLGTPAVYINSMDAGTIDEQEKYGLLFHLKKGSNVLLKVEELIDNKNLKQEFQNRRQKMLADKIDVTAFMVWFVENYPESARIMKEKPEYQEQFK